MEVELIFEKDFLGRRMTGVFFTISEICKNNDVKEKIYNISIADVLYIDEIIVRRR